MSANSACRDFDIECERCPRLSVFLHEVAAKYPDYYAKPVPAFGDPKARFLIVGLAPGMHGANRTGRPFTGDYAGVLLYQTLFDFGFSNQAVSESGNDKLKLKNCRITNAVKCLPPQNKPVTDEVKNCNSYLGNELSGLPSASVVLALGKIAHEAVLRAMNLQLSHYRFGHGLEHTFGGFTLLDSYHCSRYNTQTKRLTEGMFRDIFQRASDLLEIGH